MVDQSVLGAGPASVDRLLQRIEHEAGRGAGADLPANDAPGESVDDEGDADEPGPGADLGEVDHPQRVGPRDLERAVGAT